MEAVLAATAEAARSAEAYSAAAAVDSAAVWAADLEGAVQAGDGKISQTLKLTRQKLRSDKMRTTGKAWGTIIIILIVLGIAGLMFLSWYITGYNKAVNLQQQTQQAWADIDAALQRRLDLIPNLVNTVKGYATHEKELFENIAKSREKYFAASSTADKIAASNELGGLLSRLLVLTENYPQLRASENFKDLQIALEGTENRIAVARTRYNDAARQLNSYTREFFGSFFCRRANVKQVEYFEATEQAKTEVPKVQF
jgi:LemA protein